MRTTVIELGATALRAVVLDPTAQGATATLADQRVVLGLHRRVRRDGRFGPGVQQLVEETLRRLHDTGVRLGARRVQAVVAAALSDACDLGELRDRAAAVLGAEVGVRTHAQELELLARCAGAGRSGAGPDRAATGLARAGDPGGTPSVVDVDDHQVRLIDPARGPTGRAGAAGSLSVVACGVRDLLPTGVVDPLAAAHHGELTRRLEGLLAELPRGGPPRPRPVVSGRGVVALARSVRARRRGGPGSDDPGGVDGTVLSRATVVAVEHELRRASATQRLLLPAVDPVEVDTVAAVAVLLRGLLDHLGADGLEVAETEVLDAHLATLRPPRTAPTRSPTGAGDDTDRGDAEVARPPAEATAAVRWTVPTRPDPTSPEPEPQHDPEPVAASERSAPAPLTIA